MRNIFCETLVKCAANPKLVFLSGDLGYKALEPLQESLGERFINAGVAEQNMVSAAAGLAQEGFQPWVYSIAPFVYARPFEQIRNDVCMHDLPVRLVGNGGGYGYGVMGATHHALEDYGTMLCLSNMHVFVPAFAADVPEIINQLTNFEHPAYLRLGRCEKPKDLELPKYSSWRRLMRGKGATILVVGPLAGSILEAAKQLSECDRPDIWVLTELPIEAAKIPKDFLDDLQKSRHLFVVEEHVAQGSVGQIIAHCLLKMNCAPPQFTHRHALGYISGLYGSQNFHRQECGLDAANLVRELKRNTRLSYPARGGLKQTSG
ncbi:transketolase [Nostoc punctiforme NIES-2108]|uniref:Transketolase n=1 Tax=Nostoc punctiforme NIES-2108 TaxID=1356359 RepID=A0A367S163_NOSPU|nr:transketolase [Nostoc punctiforme NIES-2108]